MDKYANVETTKFIRLENENKNTISPTQIPIDTKRCLLLCSPEKPLFAFSGMVLYLIIHPLAGTFLLFSFFMYTLLTCKRKKIIIIQWAQKRVSEKNVNTQNLIKMHNIVNESE